MVGMVGMVSMVSMVGIELIAGNIYLVNIFYLLFI